MFVAGRRLMCVGQLQAQAMQQQQAMPQQQMQQQQAPQQMQMQQIPGQEPKEEEVDDVSFAKKLEGKKRKGLVFVFFYMSHCPHCKRMLPKVQQFARSIPHMYVMHCDIKRCPNMQQFMQVQSAPTSFLMKGGQWVDRIDGAVPDDELQQRVMQAS